MEKVFKRKGKRDTVFSVSMHAKQRFLERIDHSGRGLEEALTGAVPYTLDHGYSRAFVNREAGVVFLASGDTITSVIPTRELGFSDDDFECECGAFIQKSCRKPWRCKFCGEEIR